MDSRTIQVPVQPLEIYLEVAAGAEPQDRTIFPRVGERRQEVNLPAWLPISIPTIPAVPPKFPSI